MDLEEGTRIKRHKKAPGDSSRGLLVNFDLPDLDGADIDGLLEGGQGIILRSELLAEVSLVTEFRERFADADVVQLLGVIDFVASRNTRGMEV